MVDSFTAGLITGLIIGEVGIVFIVSGIISIGWMGYSSVKLIGSLRSSEGFEESGGSGDNISKTS